MGSLLEFQSPAATPLFRLYITVDTLVIDDLQEIPRRYPQIDLALLHLGGTRVLGILVTMDGKQGVQPCRRSLRSTPSRFTTTTMMSSRRRSLTSSRRCRRRPGGACPLPASRRHLHFHGGVDTRGADGPVIPRGLEGGAGYEGYAGYGGSLSRCVSWSGCRNLVQPQPWRTLR